MKRLLCIICLLFASGCQESLFSPAGKIAESERIILLDSIAIMLAIVIPAIIVLFIFIWWFRASNLKAKRLPNWAYSGQLELLVWSIPLLVILFLGGIAWVSSHELDPAQPIDSKVKPMEVQVVALDWKWLFIYPEQNIASINKLVVPLGTPVHLRITSATVMNVFFVPRIASEIYAMNGMVTELNLEADKPGTYSGLSAQFSGDGFADMNFDFDAVTDEKFNNWVATAKSNGSVLDEQSYRKLLKQSQKEKAYTYGRVQPEIFESIVQQKLPPGDGPETDKLVEEK